MCRAASVPNNVTGMHHRPCVNELPRLSQFLAGQRLSRRGGDALVTSRNGSCKLTITKEYCHQFAIAGAEAVASAIAGAGIEAHAAVPGARSESSSSKDETAGSRAAPSRADVKRRARMFVDNSFTPNISSKNAKERASEAAIGTAADLCRPQSPTQEIGPCWR